MDDETRQAKNVALASALGWTAKELPHKDGKGTYWILVNPDGKCVYSFGSGGASGEAQVWKHAPDFYGSLDACESLLPKDAIVVIAPDPLGDGCEASISGDAWDSFEGYRGGGATRPAALANAVLAWATAQKAAQP